MLIYLLKSTFCLFCLWAIYKLLLENEKTHRFNRFYLLFSLFFSLSIPFFNIEIAATAIQNPVLEQAISPQLLKDFYVNEKHIEIEENFDWTLIIKVLYVFIAVIFLAKFLNNLYQISSKIDKNQIVELEQAKVVLVKEMILPCTFLNYIFLNKNEFYNQEIEKELLLHEQCHAREWHTLDVLLIELLQVVFWFNPMVYLFKNAIKLNHEFLADDAVNYATKNIPFYQQLLLQKATLNQFHLASSSTFQLTKQRLKMMTKHTSATLATIKIFATIFMLFVLGFSVSMQLIAQSQTPNNQAINTQKVNQSKALTKDNVDYKNGIFMVRTSKVENKNLKYQPNIIKKYVQLTEEEKALINNPLYLKKNPPTERELKDWLDAKKYGIWINDKRVKNKELQKLNLGEIANYFSSKLAKNAMNYGKHYYQIDIMTNDYYDKYLQKMAKKPLFDLTPLPTK